MSLSGSPVCEHVGCNRRGWVVLHFGPNMTGPRRVACRKHQRVAAVAMFRDDLAAPGVREAGK